MSRTGARLIAIALAALTWSALAVVFADTLAGSRAETASAQVSAALDDPCVLREPLPAGIDARCTFELARPAAQPLVVDLDQRWQGNVLTQWLNVRAPGATEPVHFAYAQSAGAAPARLLRVFPIRSPEGEDHLAYLLGRCGGITCPLSDLVVVADDGGKSRTLLSLRLGALADVQLRGDTLTALEAWFPQGAQRPGGMVARRFAWDGKAYAMRELAMLPAPTPSPSPR